MDDLNYCPRCGNKLDKDSNYCSNCGKQLNRNSANTGNHSNEDYNFDTDKIDSRNNGNSSSFKKLDKFGYKRIVIVLLAVILILIVSFLGFTYYTSHGDTESMKYSLMPHKVTLNSIDIISTENLNSTDYTGISKTYRVTYTVNENLQDVSIEVYPYSNNKTQIDVMANFLGFNSLNYLAYDDNITSGTVNTQDVVFGHRGGDFDVDYLKVFVYKEKSDGNKELIDKFIVNLN